MTITDLQVNGAPARAAEPARALSIHTRPDGVAVVTYDVPGAPVNTLRATSAAELERVLDEIARDPAIRAAILVSGKPDTWIAGADLEMIEAVSTAAEGEAMCRAGHRAIARLAGSAKPVVAAVHGAALGGGFEIALACQARVLSDDRKTMLGLPEVQIGLLPGMNGLQRLAEKAGLKEALDHGLTGKNLRPAKAKALGVADDVVHPSILHEVAAKLALRLAEQGPPFIARAERKRGLADKVTAAVLEKNPLGRRLLFKKARAGVLEKTGGHYPAPERILQVLEAWAGRGFEASREVEARAFGELAVSTVARRLIEIFFATTELKKDPGVADPRAVPRRVDKVEVLGAGLMGAGIAAVTLQAGVAVRLKDKDDAAIARGLQHVTGLVDDDVKKKKLTVPEREQRLALLSATTDYSGLKSADLVIEAVFEDLAVKHQVLREVEAAAREGVIFASNTSSIPIAKIAAASRHPDNVVGMHYFSPVERMPLLEVIQTKQTAPEVVATAVALGKKQGKTVIVVNDGTGFYTSRILGPMMNEASYILAEGVPIEAIDQAMTAWGWPIGPIGLLDEVGIDVAAHVGPIMVEAFGERMTPPPGVAKLVADDRKGKKNQRGFYLYGGKRKGKAKRVDESVYGVLGLAVPDRHARPLAPEEIQMRCSLQLVNEALYCWGDGVLRSPRDGDIGAIFGLGFPPFRGGPFRYVDAIGAAEILRRIEGYHRRFGARWTPAPVLVDMARTGKRFYA